MKKIIFLSVLFCLGLSLMSCKNQENSSIPSTQNKILYGELKGVIVENDVVLEGVKVTAGDQTTYTNEEGAYSIQIYETGAKVSFTKEGYFTQINELKKSSFYSNECIYDFSMFKCVKVHGIITKNQVPLANAVVTIGAKSVTTSSLGEYVFEEVIGTTMILKVKYNDKVTRKILYYEMMQQPIIEMNVEVA